MVGEAKLACLAAVGARGSGAGDGGLTRDGLILREGQALICESQDPAARYSDLGVPPEPPAVLRVQKIVVKFLLDLRHGRRLGHRRNQFAVGSKVSAVKGLKEVHEGNRATVEAAPECTPAKLIAGCIVGGAVEFFDRLRKGSHVDGPGGRQSWWAGVPMASAARRLASPPVVAGCNKWVTARRGFTKIFPGLARTA